MVPSFGAENLGAAILKDNLRPEQFTVLKDLDLSYVANKLPLVPSEADNLEILQKFWKNDVNECQAAPALLIFADLMNSGYGRNIETAKKY